MEGKKSFVVTFAASAAAELEDAQASASAEEAPEAGKGLVAAILSAVERLAVHPLSGGVVPEFHAERLRELAHPPFRIVYRHDKNKVRIVRIWRGERFVKKGP